MSQEIPYEIKITLPFISPSVNSCYRTTGSRVYKSKKLVEYEKKMTEHFEMFHKDFKMLEGNISIEVMFHLKGKRHIDLDNMLKALIDSLEGRCFENDKYITEIIARKINNCKNPQTLITLKNID